MDEFTYAPQIGSQAPIINPRLDGHLFVLGPHHYHQGKKMYIKIWPYNLVVKYLNLS